MNPNLRIAGLLGIVFLGLAFPGQRAAAEDDDDRRVLSARHMDSSLDQSAEYRRLAEGKRLESIKFLKELLAEGSAQGDRKAEMMLRLADLYFQQGRSIFLGEMERFDDAYDTCFNTEGCNLEALKPDNTESHEWQTKSIRLYEHILENYPRYARADEATFYLGSALVDTGNRQDGVEYFVKLVKLYPESGYVPDSYVNIGEYYFDNDNAYKALLAYKKATAYPDHEKYGFATYKLAWCYYNVGEFSKSITTMKSVVAYSRSQAEAGGTGTKLQLGEEALKDLVRFFADAGELDEAYEYFNKLGKRDLIQSLLKRLASTYMEQGKWEEGIQTYRRLIAEEPQSPKNPDYQHEIVQAYQKMGDAEGTFAEVDRMIKTYGSNSSWARANASDTTALRGAEETIEKDLLRVATYHHDRGRKLFGAEQAASFDLAQRAYAVYLTEYPSGEKSYDVHYQYGELLYKTKQFDKAYEQYVAVVEADPNGKHSRFCAEGAIFAADEMIKLEQAASTTPPPTGIEAIPLTGWETKLVESCDRYARLYPDDEKVRNIIYKSAYLLYHKHQLEEAADRFRTVIEMEPASSEAEKAAHLILDSFVLTEDYGNLKKNAKFFYDQEGLGSRKFKAEIYDIYQKASLKGIELTFSKDQNHSAAADAYMEFYAEFPTSEELPRVLNNAALYYREADRVGDSMKVRKILVEDPKFGPKTKYYYTQVGALAFDLETIADYGQAAHYYEKLFSLYPAERAAQVKASADEAALASLDAQAADAVFTSAVFRHALGDREAAISNYKQFVATFGSDARVDGVRIKIGQIYEELGDWAQSGRVFYDFYRGATAETSAELQYYARLRYGKSLEAQNQGTKAKAVYEETVAQFKKAAAAGADTGPYADYAAEMMMILAAPAYATYEARKITGCGCGSNRKEDQVMGDNLKAKAKGLIEMEALYTDIIKTGSGEYGLAALVQLGRAYESMGHTLKTSDLPFYLTEDQAEIYKMRLEDKIYPQTQKATSAYRSALEKSWELTLYNDETAFAYKRLGELAPDEFPGMAEEFELPNMTSRSTQSFPFETEL